MLRGMFNATGLLTEGTLWGYVSRYVKEYVSGDVSDGSSMLLFMNSWPLMERLMYGPGFRVRAARRVLGKANSSTLRIQKNRSPL